MTVFFAKLNFDISNCHSATAEGHIVRNGLPVAHRSDAGLHQYLKYFNAGLNIPCEQPNVLRSKLFACYIVHTRRSSIVD